jgi:heme-degrading monooxygenase HmoA
VPASEDSHCAGVATTLIIAFEVPPAEDEAFIARWKHVRHAFDPSVLHRALRADADLRFVVVAPAESPVEWEQWSAALAFEAHVGLYEAAHEDGAPDGSEGVLLINAFEVPVEDDERFLEGWTRVRDLLSPQRGYLGTRLHRSVDEADFRFVNVARWSSPLMFAGALKLPEVREAAAAMPFASHPALYLAVRE